MIHRPLGRCMAEAEERREILLLNLALGATIAVVIMFIVLASVWGSGAVQNADDENYRSWDVPLHDRHKMDLDFSGLRTNFQSMEPTTGVVPANIS